MVKHRAERLDVTFRALADATRRAILERLARGSASMTELAEPFAMSLPAVSKHLRVLERAGLVARQREGRVHRMDLARGPLREAIAWLDEYRRFWEARLDALAASLEHLQPQETTPWPHPKSGRKPRSAWSARLPRRPRRSSTPGRSRRH
jgi:DNA-binding transcriptional ArsR family regulator